MKINSFNFKLFFLIILIFFILFLNSCNYNTYQYYRKKNITEIKTRKFDYVKIYIDKGYSFNIFDGYKFILIDKNYLNKYLITDKNFYYKNLDIGKILTIKQKNNNLILISLIPLEEYVASVIAAEMGKKFHSEALKAQAVVSRTYIIYQISNNPEFIAKNSTSHQVFNRSKYKYFLNFAYSTKDLILIYKNKPIAAFFHASSGGILTTPELVWNSKKLAYYHVKNDPYSSKIPFWQISLGKFFLKTILNRAGYNAGSDGDYIKEVKIFKNPFDQRVKKIIFLNNKNKKIELKGTTFRKIIGYTKLKSTLFNVKKEGNEFIFYGYGYGHGIGLSQIGAENMAKSGFNYIDILNFYYSNCKIINLKILNK